MLLLRLLSFALLLLLPQVGLAQQDAPAGPISLEANATQDRAIERRLGSILTALGGYEEITVSVSQGIVTLQGTTTSAVEAAELAALVTRVEGVVALRNEVSETADIARRLNPAVDRFLARLDQIIVVLPLILIAAAAFFVIYFVGSLIGGRRKLWDRLAPNAFIADLYRQIVQIVFALAGLVIALDILNASALLGTILGAAGIVGLAIGFAVRDTVENYIASIMLSVRQPFRPNDTVSIDGREGKVIRLTSRATILLSFDGNHIRIPNALVFKATIVNFTENTAIRLHFSVRIDADNDVAAARDLADRTLRAMPFILDNPEAQSWIESIADGAVVLEMAAWVDQTATSVVQARGEALRQIKLAFDAAGIHPPSGVQHIRLEGRTDGAASAKDMPARSPARSALPGNVAAVAPTNETALDQIIDAERSRDETEDLLRKDALKE